MKASIFTLTFALAGSALAQERFRCRCTDGSQNVVAGIEGICRSRGGEAEGSQLCIKAASRLTDAGCATVRQGSRAECIVDNLSDYPGSSLSESAAAAATPAPKARAVQELPQDA
ncbi:hypothetical protein CPLU01_00949 [Colletotrichum plurivorum]|uniref:Extracellular membrane protein CFEM domain-containing protein n=1 Tax=Colletotrichum plurivorum TaxID=2175906 RepID=A0A8H6NR19_9PEZI|nr:hypothetical protein CPLU01_00949 [Colletotrichum plurivorum]